MQVQKQLALILKITGTCCKCRHKAVEASGPNLRSRHVAHVLMYSTLIENRITVCMVLLDWPLTFDPLLHLWMLQLFRENCPVFDRVVLLNFFLPLIALESLPSRHCAPLAIFTQLCHNFFNCTGADSEVEGMSC
jgi:hypothetical protein